MKQSSFGSSSASRRRGAEQGGARVVILAAASFLLGAGGAYWVYHAGNSTGAAVAAPPSARELSELTRAVLRRLDTSVELRFYSQLDPAGTSEADRAFAARAEDLVSAYQREGGGKVKLTLCTSNQTFDANTAANDGIKPFNLDKGSACFLGIVVAQDTRKEVLPQLSPAWEPALEADVTRAIARLIDTRPQPQAIGVPPPAKSDPATLAEVERVVPNFATIPPEEGEGILHAAALKDLKAAVQATEAQTQEARQQFTDSQNAGSEADMKAARQRLQQIQADQMEKLKQISAKADAQIDAFRQLRKATGK